MTPEQEAHVDEFVKCCFRDTADADYIAARACYRIGLFNQFLWLGLQAIEKYLKGILLLHGRNTKEIRHDVKEALVQVESIRDIRWDFSDELHEFLAHLTTYGKNRYFSIPRVRKGRELFQMDDAVWSVRRYCQRLSYTHGWRSWEPGKTLFEAYVAGLARDECRESPHKFQLFVKGYLEEVLLTDKHTAQREQLVWKNFYYGSRRKKLVRYRKVVSFSQPAHFMHPDVFPWLSKRVVFPKGLKMGFEENRSANRTVGSNKE